MAIGQRLEGNAHVHAAKISQSPAISIGRDSAGGYSITLPVPTVQNGAFADVVRRIDFSANTKRGSDGTTESFAARQSSSSTSVDGENQLTAGPVKGRKYVSSAELFVCNNATGTDCAFPEQAMALLVFGTATPQSAIPLSGTARYLGLFSARTIAGDEAIDGSLSMLLDFGTRAISGSLFDATYWADGDGLGSPGARDKIADFTISGQVGNAGMLSGTATQGTGVNDFSGTWSAALFGPAAEEIGGVLNPHRNASPAFPYVGTFAGAK